MLNHSPQILLAFDFGMKKIGVAVGQSITQSATPLTKLAAKNGTPQWKIILELIKTWSAEACIVGLPYNMDGSEQAVTMAAKKFGQQLKLYTRKAVYFVDERLTTVEAKLHLKSSDYQLDAYAAKLILESWFREKMQYDQ